MKVLATVEHSNLDSIILPDNSFIDINGTDILIIKSGSEKYYLDVKSTAFTSNKLLLEGIISDQEKILGRCVLNIKIN